MSCLFAINYQTATLIEHRPFLYMSVTIMFIFIQQILIFIYSCVPDDIIYCVRYDLPHIHIVHTNRKPVKRPTIRYLFSVTPLNCIQPSEPIVRGTNLVQLNGIEYIEYIIEFSSIEWN